MPLDGLTLGFVARELHQTLAGARIERVNQPEKDMLVLLLRNNGTNYKLLLSASPSFARVHLTDAPFMNPLEPPMFCMLMRKHLTGGRVVSINTLRGDRVLRMALEAQDELGVMHPYEMYLEAMGRHSNLTLVRDGRIVDAIRHVTDDMSRVRQALPGLPFVLPPQQDKLPPEEATQEALFARLSLCAGRLDKAISQTVSGLSAVAAREIAFRLTGAEQGELDQAHLPELCERLAAFLRSLPERAAPVLYMDENGLPADVFSFQYLTWPAEAQRPQRSLSRALDAYYDGRDRRERMQQRSASLRRLLRGHIERAEKKLALQEEELQNAGRSEEYRVMGELLNANLYRVPRGAESVTLENYYDGQPLRVPLDVRLNPAQNAQRYFKRYQKARAAARLAAEQKEKTLRELAILEEAMQGLDSSENELDLADVRAALTEAGLLRSTATARKKQTRDGRASTPMRFRAKDGTEISVGKNALQNDRLTQSARGEELWLHAKDMPGSHVIVHAEGEALSEEALRCALLLAAWFSRGRGVAVPVDAALRKYVKKPSGAPAGFVIYTHQRTYTVSATEAEARAVEQVK